MGLAQAQRRMFESVRKPGSGKQAVSLSDEALRALACIVATDLAIDLDGLDHPNSFTFYSPEPEALVAAGGDPLELFESLVDLGPLDTDTYFTSLARLHKARLKYHKVIATQPTPTLDQVGPRGLLQYGLIRPNSLASLLLIRKWLYDIDNRAAQETGYLFEPILAGAVGGISVPAKDSPVLRNGDGSGRQIDCLLDKTAYELKLRVTIAASGQGRWGEELAFPEDCRLSGFQPVLVVFDGTRNAKLEELEARFINSGGEAYVGEDAWGHMESRAGATMGLFIEHYVRRPIMDIMEQAPEELPHAGVSLTPDSVTFRIGSDEYTWDRIE